MYSPPRTRAHTRAPLPPTHPPTHSQHTMHCAFVCGRMHAQEAIERAYQADTEGQQERAIRLYQTGLSAVLEGLQLPVQGSGEPGVRSCMSRMLLPSQVLSHVCHECYCHHTCLVMQAMNVTAIILA